MTSPASSMFLLTPPLFEANSREYIILSLQRKVFFLSNHNIIKRKRSYIIYPIIHPISVQKFNCLSYGPNFLLFFFLSVDFTLSSFKWESAKFKHHIGSSISYFLSMYKFSLHLFFSLDFAEMLTWHPHRVV